MKFITLPDPDDRLYEPRTMVESINGRFKEEFGGMFVRVHCEINGKWHLMFVIPAFPDDQLSCLEAFKPAPTYPAG